MTKCLYLMGRYEKNLICISINLMKTFEKNETKNTEKSWDILTKVLISQLIYVLGS